MPPRSVAKSLDYDLSAQEKSGFAAKHGSPSDESDPMLKWLFIVLAYLCVNMVVWIMVSPASWLIERSSFHREVILPFLRENGNFRVVPEVIVTKYKGHSLVQFTHMVPGALWAGMIPFQVHPTWRKNHRKAHRVMGYLL